MASWTGHPTPQQFPLGTTLHVFPKPQTPWAEKGQPPGAEATSAAVANDGSLTFTGLTEGSFYLAWAEVGDTDRYLSFGLPVVTASSGSVTSVNGKEGVVTLGAADVEAVGTASPAFTGTPTAPTAAEGTNSTQVATTKYADRSATAAGTSAKTEAESSATSKDSAAKTTTLSEAATAAAGKDTTLKTEAESKDATTLSSAESAAATKDSAAKTTTLSEAATAAAGKDTTARELGETNALAAATPRQGVHAAVTSEGTLETDKLTPVDTTSGALKEKLPTGLGAGHLLAVEKKDATANTVSIEGNIRGEAAQTFTLSFPKETILFVTDSSGSWWPLARYLALSSIKTATRQIVRRSISIGAGQVPANEVVLDEYVKIESGETRKILWVEAHTTSGTIKVAIARGEAGTTAISAYEAISVTSSIQIISTTQALSDKDRLRITTSAGSSPKGLWITWGEEVVAP